MGLFSFEKLRIFATKIAWLSQNIIENKRIILWLSLLQLAVIADYFTLISDDEVATNIYLGLFICTSLFILYFVMTIIPHLRKLKVRTLEILQPIIFFSSIASLPVRLLAESFAEIGLYHTSFFTSLIGIFFLLFFAVQGGMFVPTDKERVLRFLKHYSKLNMVLTMAPLVSTDIRTNQTTLNFELRPLHSNETDIIYCPEPIGSYSLVDASFCVPLALRSGKNSTVFNANIRDLEPATIRSMERLKREGNFIGDLPNLINFEDNSAAFILLFILSSKERWTIYSGDKIVDRRSLTSKEISSPTGARFIHLSLEPEHLSRAAARLLDPQKHPIVNKCTKLLMHYLEPEERMKIRNYLILLSRLNINNDYNAERWKEMVRGYCEIMANPSFGKRGDVEWFYGDESHTAHIVKSTDPNQPFQIYIDGENVMSAMDRMGAIDGARNIIDRNIREIIIKLFEPSRISSWGARMDDIARVPVENFIQHHDDIVNSLEMQESTQELPIAWMDLDEVISKITTRIHSIRLRKEIARTTSASQSFNNDESFKMKSLINRRKGVVVGTTIGMETLKEMVPFLGA